MEVDVRMKKVEWRPQQHAVGFCRPHYARTYQLIADSCGHPTLHVANY